MLDRSSTILPAPTMFRQLCLPLHPGDSVKWQIARAGRAAGFGPRRAKSIWYGTCNLWAEEYNRICAAYEFWLTSREHELNQEIAIIRARQAERDLRGRQYEIGFIDGAARAADVVAREGVDLGKGVK